MISIIASLLFSTALASESVQTDPYASVEHLTLKNGLQVFLAPSNQATMLAVRLEVDTGWAAENSTNWGVSHLLEHVLFRDKQLKDEMSYLQLIREAGGEANGGTGERVTSYFGSIPSAKGSWMLSTFAQMILNPSISREYVEKEKSTIELERGRPNPIAQTLGFHPLDYLYPRYLHYPSFWQTEFGIADEPGFTLTQEQLSTQRLSAKQVQQHYDEFYYPRNMRLFIAGKFDRDQVIKHVQETWGSLTDRSGKVLPEEKKPTPRLAPFKMAKIHDVTPYVYLGTKVWDVSVVDEMVIRSYMDYLAHRLMKEVRNVKGQTYSANADASINHGFGYAIIGFQTQKEFIKENIEIAKQYLEREAQNGNLEPTKVREAIDLYLSQFHLAGREAHSMMSIATGYADIVRWIGRFESPYAALRDMTPENYNASLKKHFTPDRSYEFVYHPSLFFTYDLYILCLLTAIFSLVALRRILTRPFANDQIRWVRKVKFTPLMSLEALALFIAWYLYLHVQYALTSLFFKSTWIQSNIFVSNYVFSALLVASGFAVAQLMLSLLPRKLMVVGDQLIIKSVTYHSKRIPLSEIESVEPARGPNLWLSPRTIWRMKHRYYDFNVRFWQPGILLHLKDGRSFYFSCSHGVEACRELSGLQSRLVQSPAPKVEQLTQSAA